MISLVKLPAVTNSLEFVEKIFNNTVEFLKGHPVAIAPSHPSIGPLINPPPLQPASETPIILTQIDVNGFYKVTSPQVVTFYVTSQYTQPVGLGWTVTGVTGMVGQLQVLSAVNTPGVMDLDETSSESYSWYFTIQSDTNQSLEGTQYATGVTIYPPTQIVFNTLNTIVPIYGNYKSNLNQIILTFTNPPPLNMDKGWIVENLPTITQPLSVISYSSNIAVLQIVDGSNPPIINAPIVVSGKPAVLHNPFFVNTYVPGFFTTTLQDNNPIIKINPNIKSLNMYKIRDLNKNLPDNPEVPKIYLDVEGKGFSQGSILSLFATGPQDEFLLNDNYPETQFSSSYKQSTNFVQYHRNTPFPPPNPYYQGNTVTIELKPMELGHLISNMYLKVQMPALSGYQYTPELGRALLKQVDLIIDGNVIESIYDDWYIIKDQLFLDADETYGVSNAVSVQSNVITSIIGSGGVITSNGSNTIHTFTTNDTFTVNTASLVTLFMIGGGGAGQGQQLSFEGDPTQNLLSQVGSSIYYYNASTFTSALILPLSTSVSINQTFLVSNTGTVDYAFNSLSNVIATPNVNYTVINSAISPKNILVQSPTVSMNVVPQYLRTTLNSGLGFSSGNLFTSLKFQDATQITGITLSGYTQLNQATLTMTLGGVTGFGGAYIGQYADLVSQSCYMNLTVISNTNTTITSTVNWNYVYVKRLNIKFTSNYSSQGGQGGSNVYQQIYLIPGVYNINIGAGANSATFSNSTATTFYGYSAAGGLNGGVNGSTSATNYVSFSNISYASGNGDPGSAVNATSFIIPGSQGSGGIGSGFSDSNLTSIGSTIYYGGGGGGGSFSSNSGSLVIPGGLGGGGSGALINNVSNVVISAATSGTINTGGGGGGGGGNGGSGIVIVSYSAVSNTIPASTLIIPLEFFFCRRHSANNKGRERLRKPYFPLCAMWRQKLYVRFTFNPNVWWCNVPSAANIDIYSAQTPNLPTLITEEIILNDNEKLYYTNTSLKYIIPKIQRESTLTFSANNPILTLTANFPVQILAWFFRNKNYESLQDGRYYAQRYSYGYTTQYIQTGIQLSLPSGQSSYVDVIKTAKITLNNIDILSQFQGSIYYSFKQPMEHGLSIPSKNIYLYSFSLTPKEYNQGGYLNFSKLNSQTTNLTLVFLPQYATQIVQGYNLYLYYYGYTLLQFNGGYGSTPFV